MRRALPSHWRWWHGWLQLLCVWEMWIVRILLLLHLLLMLNDVTRENVSRDTSRSFSHFLIRND